MNSGLDITNEKDRANRHISSLLFSRATMFHPAQRVTPTMTNRLVEVAKSGGPNINMPLTQKEFSIFGNSFRTELHGNFLLQPHRDLFEVMMAYGRTITLDDESYEAKRPFKWSQVVSAISDMCLAESEIKQTPLTGEISRDSTVFSMSMYELATRLNLKPERKNYAVIEQRIFQLSTAKILIHQLDENGNSVDVNSFSYIQEFKCCFDRDKAKYSSRSNSGKTNHVFIVPHMGVVKAITSHGYFNRLDQAKVMGYKSLLTKSFLMWISTHKPNFINTKTLDWIIEEYRASSATQIPVSAKYRLKQELLDNAKDIERDFGYSIAEGKKGVVQFFVNSEGAK